MKRIFALAAGPVLAASLLASPATAQSLIEGCPAGTDINSVSSLLKRIETSSSENRDALVQALTIGIAQKALDHAFDKNPSMRATKNRLEALLNNIPGSSYSEREAIHKEAYQIRLDLERGNYQYYMVQAAQSVAMASQLQSSLPGWRSGEDREGVSLYLAADAYDSTLLYDYVRYTEADKAMSTEELRELARQAGVERIPGWRSGIARETGRMQASNEKKEAIAEIIRGFNNCPN